MTGNLWNPATKFNRSLIMKLAFARLAAKFPADQRRTDAYWAALPALVREVWAEAREQRDAAVVAAGEREKQIASLREVLDRVENGDHALAQRGRIESLKAEIAALEKGEPAPVPALDDAEQIADKICTSYARSECIYDLNTARSEKADAIKLLSQYSPKDHDRVEAAFSTAKARLERKAFVNAALPQALMKCAELRGSFSPARMAGLMECSVEVGEEFVREMRMKGQIDSSFCMTATGFSAAREKALSLGKKIPQAFVAPDHADRVSAYARVDFRGVNRGLPPRRRYAS